MKLALPVVHIIAETLPEGWENAVLRTWESGTEIRTQYDKPDDPPSRDATAVITITDPFREPRIHRCFPGGIVELEAYRQEVVDGIHDHWVDPAEGKWEYTYHERLVSYSVPGIAEPVNQLDYIIDALSITPHTRRAQAIIWKPWEDAGIHDPACLQRLWFRIYGDQLVLNAHMRSNDAFKAAFMNIYAFTDLQRIVAERVSERLGRTITPGQYTHIADSFHIYGAYFQEFEAFLQTLNRRSFDERTFRTEDVQEIIEEAREQIARSVEQEKATGRKGL